MVHNETYSMFFIPFINIFYGYSKEIANYFSNNDEQRLKYNEINCFKKITSYH
jgi:hypothetical protein